MKVEVGGEVLVLVGVKVEVFRTVFVGVKVMVKVRVGVKVEVGGAVLVGVLVAAVEQTPMDCQTVGAFAGEYTSRP